MLVVAGSQSSLDLGLTQASVIASRRGGRSFARTHAGKGHFLGGAVRVVTTKLSKDLGVLFAFPRQGRVGADLADEVDAVSISRSVRKLKFSKAEKT